MAEHAVDLHKRTWMAHVHHRNVMLYVMTIRNDASTLLAEKAGEMLSGRSRGSCVWGFLPFLAALVLGKNEPKLHANPNINASPRRRMLSACPSAAVVKRYLWGYGKLTAMAAAMRKGEPQ